MGQRVPPLASRLPSTQPPWGTTPVDADFDEANGPNRLRATLRDHAIPPVEYSGMHEGVNGRFAAFYRHSCLEVAENPVSPLLRTLSRMASTDLPRSSGSLARTAQIDTFLNLGYTSRPVGKEAETMHRQFKCPLFLSDCCVTPLARGRERPLRYLAGSRASERGARRSRARESAGTLCQSAEVLV